MREQKIAAQCGNWNDKGSAQDAKKKPKTLSGDYQRTL